MSKFFNQNNISDAKLQLVLLFMNFQVLQTMRNNTKVHHHFVINLSNYSYLLSTDKKNHQLNDFIFYIKFGYKNMNSVQWIE